jgi:hypothetical protein
VVGYVYDSGGNANGHLTSLTGQAGTATYTLTFWPAGGGDADAHQSRQRSDPGNMMFNATPSTQSDSYPLY